MNPDGHYHPKEIGSEESAAPHAIVLLHNRPSLLVQHSKVIFEDPDLLPEWKEKWETQPWLTDRINAVGQIDFENANSNSSGYAGTGWLIADDIICTNAHVSRIFANEDLTFKKNEKGEEYCANINFRREHQINNDEHIHKIASVLSISSEYDVAFLRVAWSNANKPVPIPLATPILATASHIAVVGFPEKTTYEDPVYQEAVDRYFRNIFYVKRFSPGLVLSYSATRLTYDATTLGGNSGSPVLNLAGEAVGLHYGGAVGYYNVTVPIAIVKELLATIV